jgi:pyridoxal phosphate enzyme (YggS family)
MSTDPAASLPERLRRVREELAAAGKRSSRAAGEVTLVVVTKSAPTGVFALLSAAGVRDVGESRVQQGLRRRAGREADFRWHLVGHLQSNKARAAVEAFDVLHGVDSTELLARLERVAGELGRRPEAFLQVNVSGEPSKGGFSPAALPAALELARALGSVRVTGLMTMAPEAADPEAARPVFAGLRELRDRLAPELQQLSMGMSDDFAVAVEEGATCVRLGRRLVQDLPELRGETASPD